MSPSSNGRYGPGGTLSPSEQDEERLDVFKYLEIIRRNWILILAFGVLGLGLAWWNVRGARPVYEASALVQRQEDTRAYGVVPTGVPGMRSSELLASDIEIIETTRVLGPIVDSLSLRFRPIDVSSRDRFFREVRVQPDASIRRYRLRGESGSFVLETESPELERLATFHDSRIAYDGFEFELAAAALPSEGVEFVISSRRGAIDGLIARLQVDQVGSTNLLRIRYRGNDRDQVADVANAVAAAYQAYSAERARDAASRRREFIASRLEDVSDSLRAAQTVLLQFQEGSNTMDPASEGTALAVRLLEAQDRARLLRAQERTVAALLRTFESPDRRDEALRQMVVLSSEFFPSAEGLYDRLQEQQVKRSTLTASPLAGRPATAPEVQVTDSIIAGIEREMRRVAEQSHQVLQERVAEADRRVAALRRDVSRVPGLRTAFGRHSQEVEALQSMHSLLAEKFYEAQIVEAVEAGDVVIVEPAAVPVRALPTRREQTLQLGFLAGLLLGTIGLFLRAGLDVRLRTVQEAVEASGTHLLAVIPLLDDPNGAGARRLLASQPVEPWEAEAFRMLRTNIRFARTEQPRILLITSAEPGDGKSFVAANLASAMARSGKKVLVVDADLRKPRQHEIFQVERSPGLSDILVSEASETAIQETSMGLSVLTAGTSAPNPSELLGATGFSSLLAQMSNRFDIVLVDSPPVLAVSDTSAFAHTADGVLLISRLDKTDRTSLRNAARQLEQTQASLLGVVVNGVRQGSGYSGQSYTRYTRAYMEMDEGPKSRLSRLVDLLPR